LWWVFLTQCLKNYLLRSGLRTMILLMSVSWVAGITGMSHKLPKKLDFFIVLFLQCWGSNPGPCACYPTVLLLSYISPPTKLSLNNKFIQAWNGWAHL
jgi:hypothetical protein